MIIQNEYNFLPTKIVLYYLDWFSEVCRLESRYAWYGTRISLLPCVDNAQNRVRFHIFLNKYEACFFNQETVIWNQSFNIFTNGASAMFGGRWGFYTSGEIQSVGKHFSLSSPRRQPCIWKSTKGLKFVVDKSIQVLKSTKARPLSNRIFSQTCSACTYGIRHSEVHWLPRGKVHQCTVALRNKGGNTIAKNIISLL
jgi:hypothetical protein